MQQGEAADISRKVLQAVKIMGWQMGKTRVFLRAGQLAQLEVQTCWLYHLQLYLQQQTTKLALHTHTVAQYGQCC